MQHSPFDRVIPGQSLTDEPGAVPWEQPAMFSKPEEALDYHISELNKEDVMDNTLGMIDAGIPIDIMADSMLTSGVMNGIHSVDTKLLIAPLMYSHLKSLAMAAELDFKETMQDYEDKEEIARIKRMKRLAAKIEIQSKLGGNKMDAGDKIQQEVSQFMTQQSEEAPEEQPQEEMPTGGLMSKEQI